METVGRRGWSPPRSRAHPPPGASDVTWGGNTSVLSYSPEIGKLSSRRSLRLTQRGQGMGGQTWERQTRARICALVLKPAVSVSPRRPLPVSLATLELLRGAVVVPVTNEPYGEGAAH